MGTRSEQDDGYEPVGKAPLNMETWIAEKNNEFNAIMVSDADTRNINRKAKKESKIATVPHANLEVVGGNKGNEMENGELIHLQRSLSEKSFKSNSSEKSSSKEKKRIKEEEKEKEKLAKQEEKRRKKEEKKMEEMAKATKLKEMKRHKRKLNRARIRASGGGGAINTRDGTPQAPRCGGCQIRLCRWQGRISVLPTERA